MKSVRQGSLTAAELARLSEMLEHGQVRSDPRVPSPADRVAVSSGRAWVKRREKRRPQRMVCPPGSGAEPEREWQIARTLDELIELRRALLNETDESDEAPTP